MSDLQDVPVAASVATDPELRIEVDHSAYYRFVPVPDADVHTIIEDGGERQELISEPGVPQVVVDATWPGFKMRRITVDEPTTTVTVVHLPSLSAINDGRKTAGLGRRSHKANLTRHLEDGAWYKHFPEGTIIAVRCDDPQWDQWLNEHFLGSDDEDDYQPISTRTEGDSQ